MPNSGLQHALWEVLHRLPDTKISQNLLCASQNGIELVCTMELLDELAHAALRKTSSTKNVDGLVCDLVCRSGSVGLEQTNGSTKMFRLLCVRHMCHLVGDRLQPGLIRFDESNHLCELLSDGGLFNQLLAEYDALVAPLQTFLYGGARVSNDSAGHHEALVIEV